MRTASWPNGWRVRSQHPTASKRVVMHRDTVRALALILLFALIATGLFMWLLSRMVPIVPAV